MENTKKTKISKKNTIIFLFFYLQRCPWHEVTSAQWLPLLRSWQWQWQWRLLLSVSVTVLPTLATLLRSVAQLTKIHHFLSKEKYFLLSCLFLLCFICPPFLLALKIKLWEEDSEEKTRKETFLEGFTDFNKKRHVIHFHASETRSPT